MILEVVVVTTTPSISNFRVRFRVFFFKFILTMSSLVKGVLRTTASPVFSGLDSGWTGAFSSLLLLLLFCCWVGPLVFCCCLAVVCCCCGLKNRYVSLVINYIRLGKLESYKNTAISKKFSTNILLIFLWWNWNICINLGCLKMIKIIKDTFGII